MIERKLASRQSYFDEDEEDDEKLLEKLRKTTAWDDFLQALYDVRLAAPIVAILAILLAYHLTIAPYRVKIDRSSQLNMDLSEVRPVIDQLNQLSIQNKLLYAEQSLILPNTADTINFKFQPHTNKHGSFRLPSMFYKGVTIGLTAHNAMNIQFTSKSKHSNHDLYQDLLALPTKPTHIIERKAQYVNTTHDNAYEIGYAVYYSYEDLERQGRLSSDRLMPWKRLKEDFLNIARKFRQIYIVVWYPNHFGELKPEEKEEKDPYHHSAILQHIIPTRTGLDQIKSTAVVTLSAFNHSEPHVHKDLLRAKTW